MAFALCFGIGHEKGACHGAIAPRRIEWLKKCRGVPIEKVMSEAAHEAPARVEEAQRRIVYENAKITVWCYPESGIVHHQMHGFCHGPVFRAALDAGRAAMYRFRADSWLSDDRANGALPDADEQWGRNLWFPSVKAQGWKHWAMVKPKAAIGQMNVRRLVETYRALGIVAEYFVEVEPAFDWLVQTRRAAAGSVNRAR